MHPCEWWPGEPLTCSQGAIDEDRLEGHEVAAGPGPQACAPAHELGLPLWASLLAKLAMGVDCRIAAGEPHRPIHHKARWK